VIRRKLFLAGGSLAALILAAAVSAILIVQSDWFRDKVRERLIATVEDATGGRAEVSSFQFDWTNLRVEVRGFVLHGTEARDKRPLIRASSITVGLKIISVLREQVDVRYLNVQEPDIHLIIDAEGRTNVPEPKIKRRSERTAMDTLINLAIGQFNVQKGIFEIEGRTRIPFSARGRNLDARFTYEPAAQRYQGNLSMQPVELQWDGRSELPLNLQMATILERDRIVVSSARIATGQSGIDFSGTMENLLAPRARFRYSARVSAADLTRTLRVRGLERGTARLDGNAEWSGGSQYSLTGNLLVVDGGFRQPPWRFQNVRAEGALRADQQSVRLGGFRFSGEAVDDRQRIPVTGQARELTLRGSDLDASGFEITGLGGSFTGDARLANWNRIEIRGGVHNLEARRAVSIYSREPLPWDSLVSGTVRIEGSVRQQKDLRVSAMLAVAPAPQSPPVHGQVALTYDQGTGTLELGRSTLQLPASRIELAGAIGRQLRVHLETRDINDFLPLLGEGAGSFPLKLENGSAAFDGTVTGRPENPQVAGHLALTRFTYNGRSADSLQADVTASPAMARLQNASLARGMARAQFEASIGLRDWKAGDLSAVAGKGALRNETVADLLTLAGEKNPGLAGTVNATGQITGTLASPQWSGDVELVKGSIRSEPFDRFAAHVNDNGHTLQIASGQLSAGAKQVRVALSLDHPEGRLDSGRLHFQVQSNMLSLAEIRTVAQSRPGVQGTVQFSATGAAELAPAGNSKRARITELEADVAGRGLQLTGQPLGDLHLTAHSQGPILQTRLDSTFANSTIRGQGEWRMEGDYSGNATVTFSKIDLAGLREWISPSANHAPYPFTGFAEGELHIDGPVLKPDLLKADVQIPSLEIRPVSAAAGGLVLRNSGPIVARVAQSAISIEKAELTGRSTDITIGGKISFTQRNPLDLRVNGHAELGVLQTLNRDISASGMVTMEAAVRGAPATPQVTGRLELKDGSISYGTLPNGISEASGVILFTGDRATIQNLEATTGGGKVRLSGFAGYDEAGVVFGLHATSQQVRVRYPEGISTVADSNLDFSGTPDRSTLSGSIVIRRASVNLQSDLGSLLAKSAEPVQTPSRSGFLAGVNYDVQIETAPDIEFESALTQDIEASANLRLRGTATNPALLGRITITQGQLVFFGTKYTLNQGSISFYNAVKIEPVLDVDLETRARGIDITLTVSGPLNKLNLTPRSDPPLQFSEIVSLLTTGEAPTADLTRLGQQAATPQPFQQATATALLGQVIANPVSGRLQRFFGISKLRINPTLDPALANGVQYNPQARLTIEQQVTPDITFTYITNLTNANPQIVSMEWSVSKQWSVVAQREENGLVGLDFYLKKRFK